MILQELLTATLQQLDRGTDAQTLESWRDKLTRYLNDALADLAGVLKPCRTEQSEIKNGKLDLLALERRCVKVVSLKRGDMRLPFYYGVGTDKLHVPAVGDGPVTICYRYLPNSMRADTDEPDLPKCYDVDGAIVLYAVGRERAAGDGTSLAAARATFDLYEMAKRRMHSHADEGDAYRFINRY